MYKTNYSNIIVRGKCRACLVIVLAKAKLPLRVWEQTTKAKYRMLTTDHWKAAGLINKAAFTQVMKRTFKRKLENTWNIVNGTSWQITRFIFTLHQLYLLSRLRVWKHQHSSQLSELLRAAFIPTSNPSWPSVSCENISKTPFRALSKNELESVNWPVKRKCRPRSRFGRGSGCQEWLL